MNGNRFFNADSFINCFVEAFVLLHWLQLSPFVLWFRRLRQVLTQRLKLTIIQSRRINILRPSRILKRDVIDHPIDTLQIFLLRRLARQRTLQIFLLRRLAREWTRRLVLRLTRNVVRF